VAIKADLTRPERPRREVSLAATSKGKRFLEVSIATASRWLPASSLPVTFWPVLSRAVYAKLVIEGFT
jgi:hypothetical protein